jgi:hypothetical protein
MILSALKWYNAQKGEYPDRLEQLVPDYLPSLPEDPFPEDGKFIYKKSNDKILLYSIGLDLINDKALIKSPERPQFDGQDRGDIIFSSLK